MRHVFREFEVDGNECRRLRAGVVVPCERRAFDPLLYLIAQRGRLVTKEELLREVWQTPSSSEGVLSNTVAKLRKALGQAPRAQTPIETVHGRGYRFVAQEVTALAAGGGERARGEEAWC